MKPCVYILQSLQNNRYYVGSTNNIKRRLEEHNRGKSKYTHDSGPYKIIFSQMYETLAEVRKIELWLKRQKSKVLIDKIIKAGIIEKKI